MCSPVCRVCLAGDVGMHSIEHMQLQGIYETLTSTKFNTGDGMPNTICYMCYWQLQRCRKFSETARRSQGILSYLLRTGIQVTSDTVMQNLRFKQTMPTSPTLSVAPTQFWSFYDQTNNEGSPFTINEEQVVVKEETITEVMENLRFKQAMSPSPNLSVTPTQFSSSYDQTNNEDSLFTVKEEQVVVKEETVTEDVKWTAMEEILHEVDVEVSGSLNIMEQSMEGSSETDNKQEYFYCDVCNKCVTAKQSLGPDLKILSEVEPYACSICNQTFNVKSNKIHMQIHSGEKPYACNRCEKTFSQKHHLTIHMRIHTGEKPYACNRCEKTFSQKQLLTIHMRVHTGEKPYACSRCEKAFSQKVHLTMHMRIHTGEKPYACNRCEKTYTRNQLLITHMRDHTGEKPYACNRCEKAFSRKPLLTTHMQFHTGEKPYACNRCEKAFTRKQLLKTHMRVHTGEKPYACNICEKTFSQNGNLAKHNMRFHKPFFS